MNPIKFFTFVLFATAFGLLFSIENISAQTNITQWTFENDSIATNLSPAPSSGSGTATSLGMGIYSTPAIGSNAPDLVLGVTSDTGSNTVADLGNVWRIRAQGGSGTNAANGWSSQAPIGSQGAQFAVSTVGYTNIQISFDWYATSQGEANLMLEYSTDGTTWNNMALSLTGGTNDYGLVVKSNSASANTISGYYVSDNVMNSGESVLAGQDWFKDLSASITAPSAANDTNFAIRMVNASTGSDCVSTKGTALNNTSGNGRFPQAIALIVCVQIPERPFVS